MPEFLQSTIPNKQNWLIQTRLALGYSAGLNAQGLCAGIASMGVQAFLAGESDVYIARLKKLYALFYRAVQTTKTKYNINNDDDIFSNNDNKRKLRSEIKNLITALPADENVDLKAFFDGVEIYSHLMDHAELLPKNKRPMGQMDSTSFPLTRPISLEDKNVMMPLNFSGVYKLEDITTYLASLRQLLNRLPNEPFALRLSSGNHRISFSYDKNKDEWILINANGLNTIRYHSVAVFSKALLRSFTNTGTVVFSSTLYTTNAANEEFLEGIQHWPRQPAMLNIHRVTSKNINATGANKYTWLDVAVRTRDIDSIERLLDYEIPSKEKLNSLLVTAVRQQYPEVVKILLNHGADPNTTIKPQNNPVLHMAVQSGNLEITRLLVQAGADINAKNSGFDSPIFKAVMNENIELVHFLLSKGADIQSEMLGLMFQANKSKVGEIILLLNQASDENYFTKEITRLSRLDPSNIDRRLALESLTLTESLNDNLQTAKDLTTFILIDNLALQIKSLLATYQPYNKERQAGLTALQTATSTAYKEFSMGNHDTKLYYHLRKEADRIANLAQKNHAKTGTLTFLGTKSRLERKINEAITNSEEKFKPQP